jgi:hypothetical protein
VKDTNATRTMLDPWTALSLAATVAQFVDLGAKIVSNAKDIRKLGSSSNALNLREINNDLILVSQNLQDQTSLKGCKAYLSEAEEVTDSRQEYDRLR